MIQKKKRHQSIRAADLHYCLLGGHISVVRIDMLMRQLGNTAVLRLRCIHQHLVQTQINEEKSNARPRSFKLNISLMLVMWMHICLLILHQQKQSGEINNPSSAHVFQD